jgi:hypothetical protein
MMKEENIKPCCTTVEYSYRKELLCVGQEEFEVMILDPLTAGEALRRLIDGFRGEQGFARMPMYILEDVGILELEAWKGKS